MNAAVTVKFFLNVDGNPPGKLVDAEIRFNDGPLAGLKLVGFAVWQSPQGGLNVTLPWRTYSQNGQRRVFTLLRPIDDAAVSDGLRSKIIAAYRTFIEAAAAGRGDGLEVNLS